MSSNYKAMVLSCIDPRFQPIIFSYLSKKGLKDELGSIIYSPITVFHFAFQKIHNFCANDLGGFYLDILKDRLYTAKFDSDARRSCQVVLSDILQALLRWVSPILSFTAEEAWQTLNEDTESVHLLEWYEDWTDIGNKLDFQQANKKT